MILHFDPQQQRPPRQAPQGIDGVILQPGANTLTPAAVATLEASSYYQDLLAWGAVVVQESEEALPRPPGPVPGTTAQARATVAAEYDMAALTAWREGETRSTVRAAIDQRIATLSAGGAA